MAVSRLGTLQHDIFFLTLNTLPSRKNSPTMTFDYLDLECYTFLNLNLLEVCAISARSILPVSKRMAAFSN